MEQILKDLTKGEFVANKRLDLQQEQYAKEYDTLFLQILDAPKGSELHIQLLKQEAVLAHKSEKFMDKHLSYFQEKRVYLIEKADPISPNNPLLCALEVEMELNDIESSETTENVDIKPNMEVV